MYQHRNPSKIFSYSFLAMSAEISIEPKKIMSNNVAETR